MLERTPVNPNESFGDVCNCGCGRRLVDPNNDTRVDTDEGRVNRDQPASTPQVVEIRPIKAGRARAALAGVAVGIVAGAGFGGWATIKYYDTISQNPTVRSMAGNVGLPETVEITGEMGLRDIQVGTVDVNVPGKATRERPVHLNIIPSSDDTCTINEDLKPNNGVSFALIVNGYTVETKWTQDPSGRVTNAEVTLPKTGLKTTQVYNNAQDSDMVKTRESGWVAVAEKNTDELTAMRNRTMKEMLKTIQGIPGIGAFIDTQKHIDDLDRETNATQLRDRVLCPIASQSQRQVAERIIGKKLFQEPLVKETIMGTVASEAALKISSESGTWVDPSMITVKFGGISGQEIEYQPNPEVQKEIERIQAENVKVLDTGILHAGDIVIPWTPTDKEIEEIDAKFDLTDARPQNAGKINVTKKEAIG